MQAFNCANFILLRPLQFHICLHPFAKLASCEAYYIKIERKLILHIYLVWSIKEQSQGQCHFFNPLLISNWNIFLRSLDNWSEGEIHSIDWHLSPILNEDFYKAIFWPLKPASVINRKKNRKKWAFVPLFGNPIF